MNSPANNPELEALFKELADLKKEYQKMTEENAEKDKKIEELKIKLRVDTP